MPHIVVMSEEGTERTPTVVYRERIATPLLQRDHYAAQLVQRLVWAVGDAEAVEGERPQDPSPAAAPPLDGPGWVPA